MPGTHELLRRKQRSITSRNAYSNRPRGAGNYPPFRLKWEKEGCVPNVVFSCGQIETTDSILVYYAGADTVIGVAELDKSKIEFQPVL